MVTRPVRETCRVGRAERVPPESPADIGENDLAAQLRRLGADVILQPAIRIGPPADWRPVDAALARLGEFDWLVFSSANGVRSLFDRAAKKGTSLISAKSVMSPFRVAAIGPGTAEELGRYGLKADLVPGQFRAEALADALGHDARGRRFLLVRASRGREVLAQELRAAGALVEQIVAYTSSDVERPDPAVAALLTAGRIDWITVTSSAIARSLVRLFGEDLRRARLASMSPLTSGVLGELGQSPAAEAVEYTMAGLVAAIVDATSTRRTNDDSGPA
jgi:uroporphyrinogen III methyltransferase/synthase